MFLQCETCSFVKKNVHTMHSVLKLHEKLQLMVDARRLCDSTLASQVYATAKDQIRCDTGILSRSILICIPLASANVKQKV